jgi:ubiquinone/menaquinone biosynthesis C-methylase UbiE
LKSYRFVDYRFVLQKLVESRTRNGCLMLDAGCGKGGSIIRPLDGVNLVSVDVLRSNVVVCRQRWKDRSYVVSDLTMLPFIAGSFGGILSADVFEHIENKRLAMIELARVTARGGFLLACSSNGINPILWWDTKLPILMKPLVIKFGAAGHYERHSRFSPSSLTNTLNSAGYRMDCLHLLGYPLFSQKKRIPTLIMLSWVLFDRLTKHKPLLYLKEVLLWQASRV